MPIKIYMDHNVSSKITKGLCDKGINVMTAFEDNAHKMEDRDLLDRASESGRVIFTHDTDFLKEGAIRQKKGVFFRGIIYIHQRNHSVSQCIRDIENISKTKNPEDLFNRIEYLPLKDSSYQTHK